MTTKPLTDDEIEAVRARLTAATRDLPDGPWEWYGNTKTREVYLATVHGGRVFAMDFERWGMTGAQPRFQVDVSGEPGTGIMRKLADLPPDLGPQMVASHRADFVGIGHPVARLIAAAPTDIARLLAEIDRLTKERDEQARLVKRLREIASVAARHLESNRNSRRDNHEAGAAVRRELARYFGEAVRP